jgi:4-amino-4-deoxy-L-arabinose transferase-like glycosyltransferase
MVQTVWKRWFWRIILVALVLRLAFALGVQRIVSAQPGRLCLIAGDAEGYWELAGKLSRFEQFSIYEPPRKAMRMPGFPALLALPRILFGDNPLAARIVLAIVGTAACGLTCFFGRELIGEKVGLLAGAYTAISPTMILFSVLFLSESAFAAAMVASLLAAAKLVRTPPGNTSASSVRRIGLAFFTGILVALATYMRPTWILVGPGLALGLILFGTSSFRLRIIHAACLCAGLAITLAPWTIRNWHVTGHFVPTTLWVGPSLYDGLNPGATGDSDMQFFEDDQLLNRMSEYEMNREYRRRAWEFAATHPARVLWLALAKQLRYWSPSPNSAQFQSLPATVVGWMAFVPLFLFSALGAWYGRRDAWLLILTAAPVLYFAAIHALFVGSIRYRLPAEFPLAVLAAYGFFQWIDRKVDHDTEKTTTGPVPDSV